MDFSQPHAKEPTPEDLKKLDHLKQMIERAVEDGVITGQEIEAIKQEILRSSKGSADQLYRELELYDNLVTQKLRTDELEYGA
ncbi:hypothetical protein [Chroococcus sp. FPU101]|uniref:hypothetical protein n=1 Tax=Chroococcus sp. FPU101 TaxID=1974212 RepID=UPI001A9071BD|nr:hypothetical protein [Chroococcus sp. FPU101]GFE67964.1 hypothetical protein CFPU101_05740 [Chroococcus sp. FPU101]